MSFKDTAIEIIIKSTQITLDISNIIYEYTPQEFYCDNNECYDLVPYYATYGGDVCIHPRFNITSYRIRYLYTSSIKIVCYTCDVCSRVSLCDNCQVKFFINIEKEQIKILEGSILCHNTIYDITQGNL